MLIAIDKSYTVGSLKEMTAMEERQSGNSFGRQFTVGSVLGRSFSTLSENFGVFAVLSLAISLPTTLVDILMPSRSVPTSLISLFCTLVGGGLIGGAVAYCAFQSLRGNRVSVGESVSHGLTRLFPLFAVSLCMALAITLGTLLLVIPGIVLICMMEVAIPVCVVEGRGMWESLNRSTELTKGHRLQIFGIIFLLGIVNYTLSRTAWFVINLFMTPTRVVSSLIIMFVLVVPQAFAYVSTAVIYYTLRDVKEGVAIDALASVFD